VHRHQARERALSLLYEAEMKRCPPTEVLAALPVPADAFTAGLVEACERHRVSADERIARASTSWPLHRMATVDRLVLQMAVGELLEPDGPPVAVVIDEAVELAKTYSTDDSGAFVNGVLSAVSDQLGL
jgi:N utilization substance protein B